MQIRQAGQVAAWRCEAWLQSMQRLQACNDELAGKVDELWNELLTSGQARAVAEASSEHRNSNQVVTQLLGQISLQSMHSSIA